MPVFPARDGEVEKISKPRASNFHAVVAKLLFIVKKSQPDILLVVSFLTTRVKDPDRDGWNKMFRVMGYLSETIDY